MEELKINRGIGEPCLGNKKKEEEEEKPPSKGFSFTKFFTLLKRRVYFNLELGGDKETN